MTTIAINKAIEDQRTGAVCQHHTIQLYTVHLGGQCQVQLQGYASQQAREQGKQPMMQITASIPAIPPAGSDPVQWLYEQLVAGVHQIDPISGEPMPTPGNELAGGELVTDEITDVEPK